jgi:neutral ceramidase
VTDPSVKGYHTFNDMSFFNFTLSNGSIAQTCPAALGYGFAGGTTDGPGAFDFTQNDPASNAQNPFWALVSGALSTPTPAQAACQLPKPVLLNVGQMTFPYAWSPDIVDIQSFRVGQFIVIVSPSEATTMAGRRWRNAVAAAAVDQGITTSTPKVVIGGPANTYAHYCSTPEEYAIQRYEGASTLYGPNELEAYIYLSTTNLQYLAANSTTKPPAGPTPPDNSNSSISLITGIVFDAAPSGKSFGDCTVQPNASYPAGAVINATFVGANPRNNLRLEGTFTAVQQLISGVWTQIRSDRDWSLVYTWTNTNDLLGNSEVVISWETAAESAPVSPGTYRIVYNGDSKTPLTGKIVAFTGTSGNFTIV